MNESLLKIIYVKAGESRGGAFVGKEAGIQDAAVRVIQRHHQVLHGSISSAAR
jgi:hypothetical protein